MSSAIGRLLLSLAALSFGFAALGWFIGGKPMYALLAMMIAVGFSIEKQLSRIADASVHKGRRPADDGTDDA